MAGDTTLPRGVPPGNAGQGKDLPAAGTDSADGKESQGDDAGALRKQVDGQSAVIRRLERQIGELEKKIPAPQEEHKEEEPKGPLSTLKRRVEELEKYKSGVDAEKLQSCKDNANLRIQHFLTVAGVDAFKASLAAEAIMARVGGTLKTDRIDGQTALLVQNRDGEPITLDGYLQAFMDSQEGAALLPPKPAPNMRGISAGRPGFAPTKIRVTRQDLRDGLVKTEDVASGKVIVIDG